MAGDGGRCGERGAGSGGGGSSRLTPQGETKVSPRDLLSLGDLAIALRPRVGCVVTHQPDGALPRTLRRCMLPVHPFTRSLVHPFTMYITGVGTAAPATRYTQAQCYEALQGSAQYERLDRRSRALLQRLLRGDNGIATRALALTPIADAFDATPDVLHERYARNAPALAEA